MCVHLTHTNLALWMLHGSHMHVERTHTHTHGCHTWIHIHTYLNTYTHSQRHTWRSFSRLRCSRSRSFSRSCCSLFSLSLYHSIFSLQQCDGGCVCVPGSRSTLSICEFCVIAASSAAVRPFLCRVLYACVVHHVLFVSSAFMVYTAGTCSITTHAWYLSRTCVSAP